MVCVRKDSGVFVQEPQAVYDKIGALLSRKQVQINELFWASEEQHLGSSWRASVVNQTGFLPQFPC